MKLDIILRTHSTGNLHAGRRFATDSKEELIFKCATSLVNSINQVKNHDIKLVCIDDNSDKSCVEGLKKILKKCNYPAEFVSLSGRGHGASLLACYEWGRDRGREAIYFVEDDYLHFPSTILEMIETYEEFRQNLGGGEVGIIANDDPDSYRPQWIEPCRIVLGKHRHWRTNLFSTSTFMISKETLIKYWDIYMLHTHYGENYGGHIDIQENVTVDRVWRGEVRLFSPIPTLAVHMQFKENIAPFADWKTLYDSIDTSTL